MRRLVKKTSIVWRGWDFGIGLITGALVLAVGASSNSVRGAGVTVLLAEAAIGVAVVGVMLAALAVFAANFDNVYRRVLENEREAFEVRSTLTWSWPSRRLQRPSSA